MPAGVRRHLVGKTLRNVLHCDTAENTISRQASYHTDIFMNQRITILYTFCHVIPTKWRSYRGHKFCDVALPYVYRYSTPGTVL